MKTERTIIHGLRVATALDVRLMRASMRLGWRAGRLWARLRLLRSNAVDAALVLRRPPKDAHTGTARSRTRRSLALTSLSAIGGASAMYFLDPQHGRERRASLLQRSKLASRVAEGTAMGGADAQQAISPAPQQATDDRSAQQQTEPAHSGENGRESG